MYQPNWMPPKKTRTKSFSGTRTLLTRGGK